MTDSLYIFVLTRSWTDVPNKKKLVSVLQVWPFVIFFNPWFLCLLGSCSCEELSFIILASLVFLCMIFLSHLSHYFLFCFGSCLLGFAEFYLLPIDCVDYLHLCLSSAVSASLIMWINSLVPPLLFFWCILCHCGYAF